MKLAQNSRETIQSVKVRVHLQNRRLLSLRMIPFYNPTPILSCCYEVTYAHVFWSQPTLCKSPSCSLLTSTNKSYSCFTQEDWGGWESDQMLMCLCLVICFTCTPHRNLGLMILRQSYFGKRIMIEFASHVTSSTQSGSNFWKEKCLYSEIFFEITYLQWRMVRSSNTL